MRRNVLHQGRGTNRVRLETFDIERAGHPIFDWQFPILSKLKLKTELPGFYFTAITHHGPGGLAAVVKLLPERADCHPKGAAEVRGCPGVG